VPWEAFVSGSAGNRQVGFRLAVPTLTLVIPAILLIYGLLMQSPAAPAPADLDPPAAPEVVAALDPEDAPPVTLQTPTTEQVPVASAPVTIEATPLPTPMPTPRATPTPLPSWVGPPTFTFVALGVDQRNESEIPRTDTIMIGKVDLRVPRVSLLSIPRDLLVDIPGYGKDRINAAYVYGELYKEPGGGIGLLERTIEQSFGIRVDHFGLVDFQCFRTAVDSVGGVTLNVPRPIVDSHYPTEDYGTKLIQFEPGIQRMDGERALEYARTRYSDSDFQRIQRQQLIIAAMRDQILQLRTLPALPTLLTGCRNMRSDLGWRDYLTLATTLQSLNSNRVSFASIDERMAIGTVLASGANVLLPRWEPIRALVSETFSLGTANHATSSGASASPTPFLPPPSPSPLPFASPFPSPLPFDPSVAGPSRPAPAPESLPDYLSDLSPPSDLPPRGT
jgi:LCP family protein required for cell wall assembly